MKGWLYKLCRLWEEIFRWGFSNWNWDVDWKHCRLLWISFSPVGKEEMMQCSNQTLICSSNIDRNKSFYCAMCMTYLLEFGKHLLTDLTQLDMTSYTISTPLWEVRKRRRVLKMASTTGFPGMIDAHTFSLDWQVLVPSSTFRGKKWIYLAAG